MSNITESEEYDTDQPWSPVSYFEEENEAASAGSGSNPLYSPSKLVSLFNTEVLAVDNDILKAKQLSHVYNDESNLLDMPCDKDDADRYMVETDTNGIRVFDSTFEINKKAIFHDLERLQSMKAWKESISNETDKDLYKSNEDDEEISYLMSSDDKSISDNKDDNYSNTLDSTVESAGSTEATHDFIVNQHEIAETSLEQNDVITSHEEGAKSSDQNDSATCNNNLLDFSETNNDQGESDLIINSHDTNEIDLLVDIAENIVSNQDSINDKGTQFSDVATSNDEVQTAHKNMPTIPNDASMSDESVVETKEVFKFGEDSIDMNDEELDYLLDNLEDDPDLQDCEYVNSVHITDNDKEETTSSHLNDNTTSEELPNSKNEIETSLSEDNINSQVVEIDSKTSNSLTSETSSTDVDTATDPIQSNIPTQDSTNDVQNCSKEIDTVSNNNLEQNKLCEDVGSLEDNCKPEETSKLEHNLEASSVQNEINNIGIDTPIKLEVSAEVNPPMTCRDDIVNNLDPIPQQEVAVTTEVNKNVNANTQEINENTIPESELEQTETVQNSLTDSMTPTNDYMTPTDSLTSSNIIEGQSGTAQTENEDTKNSDTSHLSQIESVANNNDDENAVIPEQQEDSSSDNVSETVTEISDTPTDIEAVEPNVNHSEHNETLVQNENPSENNETLVPNENPSENNEALESNESRSENNEASDDLAPTDLQRSSSSLRCVRFNIQDDVAGLSGPVITDQMIPVITDQMRNLGKFAPRWIPDIEALTCMNCNLKFTLVRRRHHCRACGKIFCGQCCSIKFQLQYMPTGSLTRVCQSCCDTMVTVSSLDQATTSNVNQETLATSAPQVTLPEAPPPYSESVDSSLQRLSSISSNAPPYTEAPRYNEQPAPILTAGQALDILPSNSRTQNFPHAAFNEILAASLPAYSDNGSISRQRQNRSRTESEMSAVIMFNSTATNLPPILRRSNEEIRIFNNPDLTSLFRQIHDENEDPIAFIVNKNLVVRVKTVNMDCCVERKCWCFVSDGMGASNQEEIVILIKTEVPDLDDVTLTKKVLTQMNAIFEKAKHGHPVSDMETMKIDPTMRCLPKNTGMLFFKLTLQCSKKLLLPPSPYLFGLYIEESEIPWAKNFPLRLLLRIGAEFKYYPCPLFNVLDRTPVYNGVQRTILDLLADFTNYKYTVPRVNGVTINLRGKDTIIKLPQHRFDEVSKALNSNEDNVLSLAGNFSSTCDGHLVSVEKDGRYKTQTLSIVVKENRKVTCASFIVISAALKTSPEGIKAKASIVEDGVMVQVLPEVMKEIKTAIKDMKEYSVLSGDPANPESTSQVSIEWTGAEVSDRPRLLSPIDGTSFDNLTNMKIRHSYDYTTNSLTAKIHWVEVYFLPQDNDTVQRLSARELGQMTSSIAKACMSALSPHLTTLIALEMSRIGLRVNLAADFVEYKIGANLTSLPAELLPTLDDKLVPAIHSVMTNAQERVAVELIFQVVKIV